MIQFSKGSLGKIVSQTFKKVNAPYKLSIINEENYHETLALHLTKKSLYFFFASVFVGLFLLFSGLIFFTPLKYYIPGNRANIGRNEIIHLQKLTDSLKDLNTKREQFIYNLLELSNGGWDKQLDTNRLSKQEIAMAMTKNANQIDKASHYDYLKRQRIDTFKKTAEPGLQTEMNSEELTKTEENLKKLLIKDVDTSK